MKCLWSEEQMRETAIDEMVSHCNKENIDEAELSLRESSSLNYEEARALLGRIEYQRGNKEAALQVFEGIDINGLTPNIKSSLAAAGEDDRHQRGSSMSIHAISLLFESIFLKSKCLQHFHRFHEAALSCTVVLDIVEASLPEGLSENVTGYSKLQETLVKAVELLPELWKLADSPREAILSYRRALLGHWRLDPDCTARIQKEFAVYLLYSGEEAVAPNLRSQREGCFIPRNNIEEAILLLMILLRKINLNMIPWDATILDHLSFAFSIADHLSSLGKQIEELIPEILERRELYNILSLCYYGAGEGHVALGLLKKQLSKGKDADNVLSLLMASKICRESCRLPEEAVDYAQRACREVKSDDWLQLERTASYAVGKALSESSRRVVTECERVLRQSKALESMEASDRTDPDILYGLALENAEQRRLDVALGYAREAVKLGGGSDVEGWLLLARVLSAQKRFMDAETIVDAAIEQTGKSEQGKLLRLKAKLCLAQGDVKSAIQTYTRLLALLQLLTRGSTKGKEEALRSLEVETWHDLAHVYINTSQWSDAEICLRRSKSIAPYSSARCHVYGVLYRRQGLVQEALEAFMAALGMDPLHVPSLISTAEILLENGNESNTAVVTSYLMEALRLERFNYSAWYNLGKLYRVGGGGAVSSLQEAAECFQAAASLQASAPVEPFR